MGQTLAPGAGLTARQKQFLAVVLQEPYLLKRYYLSGGTALSCWYLHHRESYDFDFFSGAGEVNAQYLLRWFEKRRGVIGYKALSHSEQFGFHFFTLTYPDKDALKVDFSYYPSERIEPGITWKGLMVDSLYDIAVNKFQTIMGSPRGKDYVDFYCILQEKKGWSVDQIRADAGVKFGIHPDSLHLVRQLLRSVEFEDLPKMLIPFDRAKMDEFYSSTAKQFKGEVLVS